MRLLLLHGACPPPRNLPCNCRHVSTLNGYKTLAKWQIKATCPASANFSNLRPWNATVKRLWPFELSTPATFTCTRSDLSPSTPPSWLAGSVYLQSCSKIYHDTNEHEMGQGLLNFLFKMRTWQVAQRKMLLFSSSANEWQQVFCIFSLFLCSSAASSRVLATWKWRHCDFRTLLYLTISCLTLATPRPQHTFRSTLATHIDRRPSSCCPGSRMKNVRKCENESAPCCNLLCQHNKYYIQLVCQTLTDSDGPLKWGRSPALHCCLAFGWPNSGKRRFVTV